MAEEGLMVGCVYSPIVILYLVLAYYWNYLYKFKKNDSYLQCFSSVESFYPLND